LQDHQLPAIGSSNLLVLWHLRPLTRPSLQDGDCVASHPDLFVKAGYVHYILGSVAYNFASSPDLPPTIYPGRPSDFYGNPDRFEPSEFASAVFALAGRGLSCNNPAF
jgi:hypothetical protein